MKKLKLQIKSGEAVLGTWLNLGNSLTAEIAGLAGFDWLLIDLEHGSGTEKELIHQLQALEHTRSAPVVRVESFERQRINRVLDMGAEGVMCPRIRNTEEARQFISGLHYPPYGTRGVAKMIRATGYGKESGSYMDNSHDDILGIIQVETVDILDHLDEIAALDGVDVLFIGPADLSMELGVFGKFDDKLFTGAVERSVAAARKHGKAVGMLLPDPDKFQFWYDLGIRMFASGSDSSFVAGGANEMYQKLNTLLKNSIK